MTQPVKNVSRFPYGNDCMFQRAICRTFFASGSLTSSPSPSPSPSSSKSSCRWAEVQGPRWYMTHSSILSKQPAQCGLICTWYLYNFMRMQSKGSETPPTFHVSAFVRSISTFWIKHLLCLHYCQRQCRFMHLLLFALKVEQLFLAIFHVPFLCRW